MNETVIIAIILLALGVAAIANAVIRFFTAKPVPSDKYWAKVSATVTGDYIFTQRGYPSGSSFLADSNPRTYTQKEIVYFVNGTCHTKTVFAPDEQTVDIYYNIYKPSHFYTVEEYEAKYRDSKSGKSLAFWLVMGAILLTIGGTLLYNVLK